jgi:hypothetical protein
MEARGPTVTGLQYSVAEAIRQSKPNASTLRDLGFQERKQTDTTTAAGLTAALLQHFEDAGARPHGLFTASMPASMETSDSSNHSLDCGQFTPDPKHRAGYVENCAKTGMDQK